MADLVSSKQLWLLTYSNPLSERLGKDFFKKVPTTPGVYLMYSREGTLLYVGKAKNLRNRLRSYCQVKPDRSSRKTVRLIHAIFQIVWEECATEQAALLRENVLLRTHQPPYNILNTYPEMYYFLASQIDSEVFKLRLTQVNIYEKKEKLYGAFKSRRLVWSGYSALLRLLWACLSESASQDRFEFPKSLVQRHVPILFQIKINPKLAPDEIKTWKTLFQKFLRGRSKALLTHLTQRLLDEKEIHPFYYHLIQRDLDSLRDFFKYGLQRNYRLLKSNRIQTTYIHQNQIDDLIVQFKTG